ncbi:hypothetical protein M407DRAFT_13823 [Tulasnella calospora MUT 4182]|uniref:Eukaryotic translation initiation factor 3 subunit D n=1 Tax=Tulasnella calospora MUT 4182 TaxID=1051891 RepID=A0A0C3QU07_9AGAM|nr:hypothetical protein M407DRAFT_13823 [Tulasnella calospora MUT 4182]
MDDRLQFALVIGRAGVEAGGANAFAYFHVEDESSFSLVDSKATAPGARKGVSGFSRGRGTPRVGGPGGRGGGGGGRWGNQGTRGRRGGASMGRGGWRDWEKVNRSRESSVPIQPDWTMLEEIDFPRLSKLRLEVDLEEPKTVGTFGQVFAYDRTFDRITPKTERPLQILDRVRYNTTTSDDPIIQDLASKGTAKAYATDTILSWLMCCTRSVYPWDVIITHEGGKVFFDKRDGGPFDFITVNENAADPPMETDKEKDSINSPGSLSLEATFIDQHFSFQAVDEKNSIKFNRPNPFTSPEDREPLASCGYRYRIFDLGIDEDDDFTIAVRTQVEAFLPAATPKGPAQLVTLRSLNEFDSKAPGSGGAPEWRAKLDTQRGAVVATEMKNNGFKLSKYAVQSVLAGADVVKIGYVSRVNPRENSRHATLTTATMRPSDFIAQLTVSVSNGWGIVRMITDKILKMPEGRYLLIKDPNKAIIRLYSIPATAFMGEEEADIPEEDEAAE